MNKILIILAIIFMSGCAVEHDSNDSEVSETVEYRFNSERYEESDGLTYINIVTDSETGCRYVLHGGSKFTSGMTALLDEYGNPTGCVKGE